MQPQDIFGIIVRTIGLWLTLYGAWMTVWALLLGTRIVEKTKNSAASYLALGLFFTIVGGALLMGADTIVHAAYK